MEYRRLGSTGEKISTIGMGTWRIGSCATPGERTSQVNALKRGVELGINHIDTAEMYHSGRSEEVVGEAVKGIRKDVFIASKVAPGHLHHDDVIAACKGSLKRLDTSYVDLYMVHWPDSKVPLKETMSAMEKLVEDGLVRFIGVSNFSVAETEAARTALPKSELVSNQVEYSLEARTVEADVLPYCSKEKLTLIAYSPLARGNITNSIPEALLHKYKMTAAQAMLNWVTRSENVVAIPKATKIVHLEENAAAVSRRFTPDEYEQLSKI